MFERCWMNKFQGQRGRINAYDVSGLNYLVIMNYCVVNFQSQCHDNDDNMIKMSSICG